MSTREILSKRREERGATPAHFAAFVGLPTSDYWDLEMSADGVFTTLTFAQFLRLCVITQATPRELLPEHGEPSAQSLVCAFDSYGNRDITATLRESVTDWSAFSEQVGWEREALDDWLSSDNRLADIPMLALTDLCSALKVSLTAVVEAYLVALGWPSSEEKAQSAPLV